VSALVAGMAPSSTSREKQTIRSQVMDNVYVLFTVALAIGIACLVALPADASDTRAVVGTEDGVCYKVVTGWGNTYGEAERQAYSYLSQHDVIKIVKTSQGFDGTHEPRPYYFRIERWL
jgi:hypothetical protein